MNSESQYQSYNQRRKRALETPLVTDPNAKILELLRSIGNWVSYTGTALILTGIFSILTGFLFFVGMVKANSVGQSIHFMSALLPIFLGMIQLALALFCHRYVQAMAGYLKTGNQLRLVDVFYRQRAFAILFGVMGFSLLGLFVLGFGMLAFQLFF